MAVLVVSTSPHLIRSTSREICVMNRRWPKVSGCSDFSPNLDDSDLIRRECWRIESCRDWFQANEETVID